VPRGRELVADDDPPPPPRARYAAKNDAKPTLEDIRALLNRLQLYEDEAAALRRAGLRAKLEGLQARAASETDEDRKTYIAAEISDVIRALDRVPGLARGDAFDRVAAEPSFRSKRWLPWLSRAVVRDPGSNDARAVDALRS
jgi:hypothetical protein